MKKTFITNLALLLFLNLLVKPFWIFGIDRQVQVTVGPEEYGVYAALFSFSIILNMILDMGITNFNNKNIAQHNHLLRKYFSNTIVLKFFLGIVYSVVALIIGISLGYGAERLYMFGFLLFNQFLLSLILYLRSNISGLLFFKTDSIISVVDKLLMIFLCGYLLLVTPAEDFKIEWFIYSQTIAYSLTALIAFVIVYRKVDFFRIRFDYKFLLVILKQSYPFAILALLMGLYTRMDMVMVEYMLEDGAREAGIYAQSFRVLDAVCMFAYLFATLLLPMFSRMIKLKEDVSQLVKLSFLLLIIPVLVFVIGSYFYGWELMKLMYSGYHDESTHVFKVLILSFVPMAITYIFGTLLTANNSLKTLNIVASLGMVLNFLLNLYLIPNYGAYGAAIASLFTQGLTAVAQIIIAKRVFKFKFDLQIIITFVIYSILVFFAYKFMKGMLENWIYNLIVIAAVCLVLAMVIRLIKIKELISLVKDEV